MLPVILIGILLFVVYCWFYTRGDALTGYATVVSRRVGLAKYASKWSEGWNYLVTFRFSDGDELELFTSKEEYAMLKEGTTGTLVWHKDVLSYFEPDREVIT